MIKHIVHAALGIPRFTTLFARWKTESQRQVLSQRGLSVAHVIVALALSILPVAGYILRERTELSFDLVSILIGLSAISALIARRRLGLSFRKVPSWRESLSLTHTAFALGCVPLVVLIVIAPEQFFQLAIHRGEVVRESSDVSAPEFSFLLVLGIATWAGLTEELIFRGMLLPTLRRWDFLRTLPARDYLCVLLSAAVFAAVHIPLWGPYLSVALFGIGCGFGIAYIVTGELLLPLIVYHIAFDFIALCVAAA